MVWRVRASFVLGWDAMRCNVLYGTVWCGVSNGDYFSSKDILPSFACRFMYEYRAVRQYEDYKLFIHSCLHVCLLWKDCFRFGSLDEKVSGSRVVNRKN